MVLLDIAVVKVHFGHWLAKMNEVKKTSIINLNFDFRGF